MDYEIQLKTDKAFNLYNGIERMTEGGDKVMKQRSQVQEKIKELWPFLFDENLPNDTGAVCSLKITSREMRALANGILDKMDRNNRTEVVGGRLKFIEGTDGSTFNFFMEIGKSLKLCEHINEHIKADRAEEFEGRLDDELELTDDERKEAKEKAPAEEVKTPPEDLTGP